MRPSPGAIESAMAGAPGRTSVVVHNLSDGRFAAFNEGEVYYAASLFKMGILYEVYKQRDAGILDMKRLLTLEQKYADNDLGTMAELGLKAGDMLTVEDAVGAMALPATRRPPCSCRTPLAAIPQTRRCDRSASSTRSSATATCPRPPPT